MLTKITDVNLTGIFWQSYDLFQHWSEGIEEMENVSDDEKNQISDNRLSGKNGKATH